MSKLYRWLIAGVIFLIPSNLFLKLAENQAYLNGLLVDYLLPKIYLSDVLIGLLLSLWLLETLKSKRSPKFKLRFKLPQANFKVVTLIFLVLIAIIYQFTTNKPFAAIWYLLKIGEMIGLAFFLLSHPKILSPAFMIKTLAATILFQSLLAIYQFQAQSSLLGYKFLGEPQLNTYLGLNRGIFNGEEKILPYGTTPHPNVLAGFLSWGVLISLFKFSFKKIKANYFQLGSLLIIGFSSLLAIFLTQSFSAWITLLAGLLLISLYQQKPQFLLKLITNHQWKILGFMFMISVLVPLTLPHLSELKPTATSLSRRVYLNQNATQMFLDHPLLGVGLNNFTTRVEEYGFLGESIRFVQPVHHLGLLILSETGILGVIIICLSGWLILATQSNKHNFSQKRNKTLIGFWLLWIIIFLPIATLDHYLLTTQTGLLMLVFTFSFLKPPQS